MKKDYSIKSNRITLLKHSAVTVISFLVAFLIVFAVFYLVVGRKSESWLDGNSGTARTSVFPFVYLAGKDLYTVDGSLTVRDIDNNATNAYFDNKFQKVYYIYEPTHELFEYDIKEDARILLCSNVSNYKIFSDRVIIPFIGTDSSISYYDFNSKSSSVLRNPIDPEISSKIESSGINFISGKSSLFYYDNFDTEAKTADLCCFTTDGKTYTIDSGVLYKTAPTVFKNDSAVSYYTGEGLKICPRGGEPFLLDGDAKLVSKSVFAYAELPNSKVPSDYDTTQDVRYYTVKNDGADTYNIYSFDISGVKLNSKFICSNAAGVVNYDPAYSVLVYTVVEDGNRFVYFVRGDRDPSRIMTVKADATVYFDTSASLVYVFPGDDKVIVYDIFNRSANEVTIEGCGSLILPVFGKPFSVISSLDFTKKIIFLNQYDYEIYNSTEMRLYGKPDDKYLNLRSLSDSNYMSLDLVDGATVKRIANNCDPQCVIYDKEFDNIIYFDKGTLYVVKNGNRIAIADYTEAVKAVTVLTQ